MMIGLEYRGSRIGDRISSIVLVDAAALARSTLEEVGGFWRVKEATATPKKVFQPSEPDPLGGGRGRVNRPPCGLVWEVWRVWN